MHHFSRYNPIMSLINVINQQSVQPGTLALWALGQMGFAVKGADGRVLYLDPVLSDVVALTYPGSAQVFQRAFPPPILPGEITNAFLVLCTHEHLDHTDPLTLEPLAAASPQARFITSHWAKPLLERAGIDAGRCLVPHPGVPLEFDGLRIHAVPAAHYAVECDPLHGCRWMGFVIEWNGVTLYHSGDTIAHPALLEALQALPTADAAILAVNGRDAERESRGIIGNLMPEEALALGRELGWGMIIPGHNDLYAGNCINPGELVQAAARTEQKVLVLAPGEGTVVPVKKTGC